MENILIADSEREVTDLIEIYLQMENYTVFKCYTAREAMMCIESQELDMAIIDIRLPDTDGLTVCRKIREKHIYPVIMLTGNDTETDRITGLSLGADDFILKPIRPLELVARVKAHLRRYKHFMPSQPGKILQHKDLRMNISSHECTLKGEAVHLTPTEFSILQTLLENAGAVVSLENIFNSVWGDECYSRSSSTITVHVRHIREKLKDTGKSPTYIKTVWGVGYKV